MNIDLLTLQIDGIDIANLKESYIRSLVQEDLVSKNFDLPKEENLRIYVNVEGTAVTAYYICSMCQGAVSLNIG